MAAYDGSLKHNRGVCNNKRRKYSAACNGGVSSAAYQYRASKALSNKSGSINVAAENRNQRKRMWRRKHQRLYIGSETSKHGSINSA